MRDRSDSNKIRVDNAEISRASARAIALGAFALGVAAVGAVAIGSLFVGALIIGQSIVGRARFGHLEIGELAVKSLRVEDAAITRRLVLPDGREHFAVWSILDDGPGLAHKSARQDDLREVCDVEQTRKG